MEQLTSNLVYYDTENQKPQHFISESYHCTHTFKQNKSNHSLILLGRILLHKNS